MEGERVLLSSLFACLLVFSPCTELESFILDWGHIFRPGGVSPGSVHLQDNIGINDISECFLMVLK